MISARDRDARRPDKAWLTEYHKVTTDGSSVTNLEETQ